MTEFQALPMNIVPPPGRPISLASTVANEGKTILMGAQALGFGWLASSRAVLPLHN